MAKYFAVEAVGYGRNSPDKSPGNVVGTVVRRTRASFVSTGANTAAADQISLGRLPIGASFMHGRINATASMAAVSLAVGNATTAGKYRTSSAGPAADTPAGFGNAAAIVAAPLVAEEEVLLTLSAALPAGTIIVDIEFSTAAS